MNDGLNLMINTPLIIRWSLDSVQYFSSIQKIEWAYKSSFILSIDLSVEKTNFKVNEVIEFELSVKNNTLETMELICILNDNFVATENVT